MAWFKVDDGFYTSMKFLSIPRQHQAQAAGAWLLCGTWSADKMTDGFVPYSVMDMWEFETDVVGYLVEVGLWDHNEERMGIQFHDWCDYQPTRDELMEKRNRRAEVNSANAKKRWEKSKNDASVMQEVCETDANTMQNNAPEPEPEPLTNTRSSDDEPAPTKSPYSADFEQFWKAYPRKQAKGKAWEVYKRLKRANILPRLDVLIPAAENYELATRHDPQFQKLCEGWLNGHRWQDEPIAKPFSNEPPKKQFTGYEDDDDV
jgi:hypothetical protein